VKLEDGLTSGPNPIVFAIQATDDDRLADRQESTFFAPMN
jgi:hypothetical protein